LGVGQVAIMWRGSDGERSLDLRDIHFYRTHSGGAVEGVSDGRSRP
jgi:hypothetical protein